MTNICRENREHVERLTNMQLKLYLRQQSAKLSGNKALLTKRVLNMPFFFIFYFLLTEIFILPLHHLQHFHYKI